MMSSLALTAVLLGQMSVSGSASVELNSMVIAHVNYADHTGSHPEIADHGTQLIRQMWAKSCGQDGGKCSHGPYTVSLTISETQMGLYCLGNIAGQPFNKRTDGSYSIENVWLRCSKDGAFFVDNEDVPTLR